MVNDIVDDESELDITVTLTEQRPAFTATIFAPDTLHNFDDDAARVAATDDSLLADNPAAAIALTSVIDAPRFNVGDPTMFIDIDFVAALPFFGVTLIVTVHLPGATPMIFAPDTLQIAFDAFATVPDTFAPFGTAIRAIFANDVKEDDLPVFTATVFAIATTTDVRMAVLVGTGTGVAGAATSGVGAAGVAAAAVIVKDRVISSAAAYVSSPAWFAVNVHIPAVTIVTEKPDTVHTDGVDEVTVTVKPESDDAATVNVTAENA